MEHFFCFFISYLIGSVNPSYILGKIKGVDIRNSGSGNAGASNALIHFGNAWGVACALLDIAKPIISITVSRALFRNVGIVIPLAGVSTAIGHMFPFYMRFRGGKGLACLGGIVLSFNPILFLIMLLGAVVLALLSGYIFIVSVTAPFAFTFVYLLLRWDVIGTLLFLLLSLLMLCKHGKNFKRLRAGTELKLSFLWKKDSEVDRVKQNGANTDIGLDK